MIVVVLVLGALGVGYFLGGGDFEIGLSPGDGGVSHTFDQIIGVPDFTEDDPTVAASVKDGVSWGEVSGKPSFQNELSVVVSKSCSGGTSSCTATCNSGTLRTGCSVEGSGRDGSFAKPSGNNGCLCGPYSDFRNSIVCHAYCLAV